MPKISVMERFKDSLILCSYCKKYLPKESFFDWSLRKNEYCCKDCRRKYANERNYKHGVKSREEIRREREQKEQKELLENPFEEINLTIAKVVKNLGEYKEKKGYVCGYCDRDGYVIANGKNLCEKHFLIVECLSDCKPLSKTVKFEVMSSREDLGFYKNWKN